VKRLRGRRRRACEDPPRLISIKKLLKTPPLDEEVFTFGSFRLIRAQRTLSEDGRPLRLGSRAFDILAALTERAGETISKEE
jgi:DNA-binding response OmpR family regulator